MAALSRRARGGKAQRAVWPADAPTTTSTIVSGATMTLLRPMAAPTNLAVTGTPATASLRWDAAPGAIGYYVSRTDAAGATVRLTANAIGATGFEDVSGGIKPGIAYTYHVTAAHPNGGVGTAEVSFTAPAAAVPAWVRLEPRGSESALVWALVPGAASYPIIESWTQPAYYTVYSADGKSSTVQTRYDYMTRTHVVAAPQSSLSLGTAAKGHRFDVGAAYPPGGVTAPRGQWPFMVVP
jgi:hypothetical protein